jgi:uncharacterized protein (TIGR02246 family)
MRACRCLVAFAVASTLLGFSAVCTSSLAQAPASADELAVREVVRRYVDARETNDPKAIEALLTLDADQLVSDGVWRRGRDELVRGMLESTKKTGGRRTIKVETVRFLTPEVAIADGRYDQTGLTDGSDRRMWTSIVLKRTTEGWRISAIRNMLPAPPAAKK